MADFRHGYFGHPNNKKIGLYPEKRSQTSRASDHICKPVLVDVQGKRRPVIVLPGNTESYVTRIETYTEEVYSSSDDESQHSYTTDGPAKYYDHFHDGGNRHSSPARDYSTSVDKFITKVQTEASQPGKYPLSPIYRRQSHCTGVQDDNCYSLGRSKDHNKKIADKPSGYVKQHIKYHEGYKSDNDEHDDNNDEPHKMMTNHSNGHAPLARITVPRSTNGIGPVESKAKTPTSGWRRLSDATGDAPLTRDVRVSSPMNEIEKAIEYLKEAVNFQSGKNGSNSKNAGPASDPPRDQDSYAKFIDSSREAARRHGNFKPSRPVQEACLATIDSEEAKRRYNGARV